MFATLTSSVSTELFSNCGRFIFLRYLLMQNSFNSIWKGERFAVPKGIGSTVEVPIPWLKSDTTESTVYDNFQKF